MGTAAVAAHGESDQLQIVKNTMARRIAIAICSSKVIIYPGSPGNAAN
jgi:hypothetical protein